MKGVSKKSDRYENPTFMSLLTKDLRCVLMRLRKHYPVFVEKLREVVRIPSEVTSPKHCFAMLDWAKENLQDLGFHVRQVENPETTQIQGASTYPFLLASSENAASNVTICAYFRLDVEPVERDEDWSHPPFGGVKEESCIFGRGTSWGKGPFVAWLSALKGYRTQGQAFPIKIKFVIECGGTSGSPGFRKLLEDEKEDFFADVNGLFMSEGSWLGETTPCLVLGGKGACEFSVDIVCAALNVDSELNGGIIHEAMTDMIYLLNSLIDDDGNMLIPCIEQGVLLPTEAEIKNYDGLDLNVSDLTSRFGLRDSATQEGNIGHVLASLWRQPHLRMHSVNSCYPRGSIDHIIPGHLRAEFTVYTVPDQKPSVIEKRVLNFLNELMESKKSKNEFSASMTSSLEHWTNSKTSRIFKAASKAIRLAYRKEANIIFSCNSIPIASHFNEIIKKSVLVFPMSPANDHPGSENEKIDILNFRKAARMIAIFLFEVGILEMSRNSSFIKMSV